MQVLDPHRQQELERSIAEQLADTYDALFALHRIPTPWATIRYGWSQVNGRRTATQRPCDATGAIIPAPPVWEDPEGFEQLREGMADPERGAWWAAEVEVRPDRTASFRYEFDRRVYWNSEHGGMLTPSDNLETEPALSEFVTDLARFPDAPLPAWLVAALADEAAKPQPPAVDLDAAFGAVDHDAPEALRSHIEQPGWPQLWDVLRRRSERMMRDADRDGMLDLAETPRFLVEQALDFVQFVVEDAVVEAVDPLTVRRLHELVGSEPPAAAHAEQTVAGRHADPHVQPAYDELVDLLARASSQYLETVFRDAPRTGVGVASDPGPDPHPVPASETDRLAAIARGYFANLIGAERADAELRVEPLPDDGGAVCVMHAVRGGGKIYVAPDGSALFVGSALDFETGLAAFRAGTRTPHEKFVRPGS